MNDTQATANDPAVMPTDPAVAASDPAMFASLTTSENQILSQHLTSGWYKQHAVYPTLSEPWKETERGHSTTSAQHGGFAGRPSTSPRPGNDGQHLSPRTRCAARCRPMPGNRSARPRADHGHHPRRRMLPGVGNRPGIHPRQSRVIPPGRRRVGNHLAAQAPRTGREPRGRSESSRQGDMQAHDPSSSPGPGLPETQGRLRQLADWATLPTRADLDAATARTAAVMADPAATRAERVHAAEMERPCTCFTCSGPAPTPSCRPKPNWRQAHDPRPRPRRPAHRAERTTRRSEPGNHPARTGPACSRSPAPARRRAPGTSPPCGGSPDRARTGNGADQRGGVAAGG